MAITLTTAARNAACDAVVDLVDVGVGVNGTLEILDGATVLVTINLAGTAFGAAVAGVATAAGLPLSGVATATGTADNFKVKDQDGTVVWTGDVATSGAALNLDNTSINILQNVTINSFTHTQPA